MGSMTAIPERNWWQEMPEENLWYLVGLIASDGCLSGDGRHIDITAKDGGYLELVKKACGIPNRVSRKYNGRGQLSHRIQLSSVSFWLFLQNIGLMPDKSKRLGALSIPDDSFPDFLRGVIDGDGCIRKWRHPQNGGEQWSLKIVGASRPFVEWLGERTRSLLGATGRVHLQRNEFSGLWVLKFGKMSAQSVLEYCYFGSGRLAISEKAALARACIDAERGWSRSRTLSKSKKKILPEWRNRQTQGTLGKGLLHGNMKVINRVNSGKPTS